MITLDSSGNVISPFAAVGLKHLDANVADTGTGEIYTRAWMASTFMNGTDMSKVAPFGVVALAPSQTVTVAGYTANTISLARTTAAANETTAVSAPCNASASQLEKSMNESFELTVPEITTETMKLQTSATAASVLQSINASLANSGQTAPAIQISVGGTTAATYQGSFTGQAVVSLDGTKVATQTLTLPTASGVMQQQVSIPLGSTLTATATSKFDVAVTGTLKMTCPSSDATSHTVSAKPGVPSLTLYSSQAESSGTGTGTGTGG